MCICPNRLHVCQSLAVLPFTGSHCAVKVYSDWHELSSGLAGQLTRWCNGPMQLQEPQMLLPNSLFSSTSTRRRTQGMKRCTLLTLSGWDKSTHLSSALRYSGASLIVIFSNVRAMWNGVASGGCCFDCVLPSVPVACANKSCHVIAGSSI